MARTGSGRRRTNRAQERRFAKSVAFPRWIGAPFVLVIGFMLWIGVLADPSGKLKMPGPGSILYLAPVIAVAAYLAYADRTGNSSRKSRRFGPGCGGRGNATAR